MSIENAIHQQLNSFLIEQFSASDIQVPAGAVLRYGITEDDDTGELLFSIEQVSENTASHIARQLNKPGLEHLIDCYTGLEHHMARQQAEEDQIQGKGLFKQVFAMRYDGSEWLLHIDHQPVNLH